MTIQFEDDAEAERWLSIVRDLQISMPRGALECGIVFKGADRILQAYRERNCNLQRANDKGPLKP